MSEERVFYPGNLKNLRKTKPITIHKKTYPNLEEAVRQLKPKASTRTISRKLKAGMTPEKPLNIIQILEYASGIIYLITNKTTKKEYVGVCTVSLEERWSGSNGHRVCKKRSIYK